MEGNISLARRLGKMCDGLLCLMVIVRLLTVLCRSGLGSATLSLINRRHSEPPFFEGCKLVTRQRAPVLLSHAGELNHFSEYEATAQVNGNACLQDKHVYNYLLSVPVRFSPSSLSLIEDAESPILPRALACLR